MDPNNTRSQWERAKAGLPVQSSDSKQEFAGGLVVIGLEQQAKEQREKTEALYMETNLVVESGLDTDDIIFLAEQEEKQMQFLDRQKQEIAQYKDAVANKVVKPESSYVEDLYNLNKKRKMAKQKNKRKVEIGMVGVASKKAKLESTETKDEGTKVESPQKKTNQNAIGTKPNENKQTNKEKANEIEGVENEIEGENLLAGLLSADYFDS
jgi:hypothetical protein